MSEQRLRPLERRLLRLADQGVGEAELARRFGRSPEHIGRVLHLARLPGRTGPPPRREPLRPIERRVLRWRDEGADFDEVAARFRRSPRHMAQVERLAHYKMA
jgi:hypothetical protein